MTCAAKTIRCSGFTFLEVLVVLVLLGILTLVTVGRFQGQRADLTGYHDLLKSHIRYAQVRTMNTNRCWGIQTDPGGGTYWLFTDGAVERPYPFPGETTPRIDLAAVGLALAPAPLTLSFDERGRPCSDARGRLTLTQTLRLTLSSVSAGTAVVTVTRNTGFVP